MTKKEIADRRRVLKKDIRSCKEGLEHARRLYRNTASYRADLEVAKKELAEFEKEVAND